MGFKRVGLLLVVGIAATAASGQPIYNPGNGHYYEQLDATGSWAECRTWAESRWYNGQQGYLATVTSPEENEFITSILGNHNALLGGYQDFSSPDYAEPGGGWRWVTEDEPWAYTNWHLPGEPNNDGSGEDALMIYGQNYAPNLGIWNDVGSTWYPGPGFGEHNMTYIVEYAPEPGTLGLLLVGGFAAVRRRRAQA